MLRPPPGVPGERADGRDMACDPPTLRRKKRRSAAGAENDAARKASSRFWKMTSRVPSYIRTLHSVHA